jgi:predicted Zn-dependent protease
MRPALRALVIFIALGASGALHAQSGGFLAPGYQPSDADETGLWRLMDRAEEQLKTSRFVVRDPALNAYLHEIVCRLDKAHCADIRIYVVRTPQFNASMAPNGMMEIWTGLLLRCTDEAQLAAIIGHELGHYLRRHSLALWRDARDKASLGNFLGLGLAAAGMGRYGDFANLALVASIYSYSRDNEREADQIGERLLVKAGYAPLAAAEIWDQLIAEYAAGTADRSQSVLFASHPTPEERLVSLREAAEAAKIKNGERGAERYRSALAGVRATIADDELALRQYGRSAQLFERLLAEAPDDGLLWYAKGEVYRLRGEPGDLEHAAEAYARALQARDAPPETYRSVMRVALKRGDRAGAQTALENYLARVPGADDAGALKMLFDQ